MDYFLESLSCCEYIFPQFSPVPLYYIYLREKSRSTLAYDLARSAVGVVSICTAVSQAKPSILRPLNSRSALSYPLEGARARYKWKTFAAFSSGFFLYYFSFFYFFFCRTVFGCCFSASFSVHI